MLKSLDFWVWDNREPRFNCLGFECM